MKKADISVEALVKIAFVLIVAIIIFILGFSLIKGAFDNIRGHKDDTEPGVKNIFDLLANMFSGCKEDDVRCVGDRVQTCVDGNWETSEQCSKGCDKERNDCAD
jgi:hypothetical protein